MRVIDSYRARVDAKLDAIDRGDAPVRVPLSAGQHILHLLLTIFTGGLWLPVWFFRGLQGNKVYRPAHDVGPWPAHPPPGWREPGAPPTGYR